MEKIIVDTLSFTITQNCNLKCAHCFRGERQNVNVSEETINNTFSNISEIKTLCLTGGEIFLSDDTVDKIKKVINQIKNNKIKIHNIAIFTNGVNYNKNIEDTIVNLYNLADDKSNSFLVISKEKFHNDEVNRLGFVTRREANEIKFSNLADKIGIRFGTKDVTGRVDNMGRAKNIDDKKEIPDIEKFNKMQKFFLECNNFNIPNRYVGNLKVHTNGNLYIYCISYDMIAKNTLFNINKTDDIMFSFEKYYDEKYGIISRPFIKRKRKDI